MAETADGGAPAGEPDRTVPALIVVCGFPGVGKSRVAGALADHLGASVFRTDAIRKELYDDPTYSKRETEEVYAELLERAVAAVESDGRAILDGTYRRRGHRRAVVDRADGLGIECGFLKVECPEAVVRERVPKRTDDVSDAGVEEYYSIRESFDPLERAHVTVDNSGNWERTREQLVAAFPADG